MTGDEPQQRTPAEHAEDIVSALLRDEPDGARRFATASITIERLRWARAVSAHQAVQELGSVAAAADRLGMSRQALNKLLLENDQDRPRAAALAAPPAAARYGTWFGEVSCLADETDRQSRRHQARDRVDKMFGTYLAAPATVRRALGTDIPRWIRSLSASSGQQWRNRLDLSDADVGWDELPAHLGTKDQGVAIVTYHHARAADQRARRAG